MLHNSPPNPASRTSDPKLVVEESQSFAAFDRWMDGQLDRLVARWIHAAAPNAHRAWPFKRTLQRR